MTHDLTRDELPDALLAWCYLSAHAEPLADTLPASLTWLRALWDVGDEHLPLTLVHDLGHLLLRGRDFRFASARDLALWPEHERAARLDYEDRVLGRWALDPTVLDAHVLIAGTPEARRDTAVAHAVGLALSRPLRDAELAVAGNPARLRGLTGSFIAAAPDGFEALRERVEPEWAAWAFEQRQSLTPLLPLAKLFRPEDLWEIAHLASLPSESARLALREVHGLAARVGPVSAAVIPTIRQTAREVPVEAEDADQYPAGGFDAIATRGVFENLVRSEVAYVGEGRTESGGVDLFDIRFAEGELLYYTRDESPQLDARRDLTIVIDRPAEQRYKQPALEAQTLVLVEALALALQSDLSRVFGPAGSRVRFAWRCETDDDRSAADEEMALLALPLASEIAHRRVELLRVDAWSDLPVLGRVVFSPRAMDEAVSHVAWVRVGDARWSALDLTWNAHEGPAAMRALADALLVAVARRRLRRAQIPQRPSVSTPSPNRA